MRSLNNLRQNCKMYKLSIRKSGTSQFAMRTWILLQIVEVGFITLTYCHSGCQSLLVHSDVFWSPSSSGLFYILYIRVSHFDK